MLISVLSACNATVLTPVAGTATPITVINSLTVREIATIRDCNGHPNFCSKVGVAYPTDEVLQISECVVRKDEHEYHGTIMTFMVLVRHVDSETGKVNEVTGWIHAGTFEKDPCAVTRP